MHVNLVSDQRRDLFYKYFTLAPMGDKRSGQQTLITSGKLLISLRKEMNGLDHLLWNVSFILLIIFFLFIKQISKINMAIANIC